MTRRVRYEKFSEKSDGKAFFVDLNYLKSGFCIVERLENFKILENFTS